MNYYYLYIFLLRLLNCSFADIDHTFEPTKCEICHLVVDEWVNLAKKSYFKTSSEFADHSDGFCARFNEYHVHKEKTGIDRFSRKPSATMLNLKKLKNKGVDVKLDIPYEMWDLPSAEVTVLRQGCERIMGEFEDEIEEWFLGNPMKNDLMIELCVNNYIKDDDASCLSRNRNIREL